MDGERCCSCATKTGALVFCAACHDYDVELLGNVACGWAMQAGMLEAEVERLRVFDQWRFLEFIDQ